MTIEEARGILTIPKLWKQLGIPGEPETGQNCISPFRDERNPSFNITKDGQVWFDYASKEGGNAIHFLAQWLGVSPTAATPKFVEMAGGNNGSLRGFTPAKKAERKPEPDERPLPKLPPLRDGSDAEYRQLGKVRRLNPDILRTAHRRGFLSFTAHRGQPAWLLTDKTRKLAQARRMSGEKWGNGSKVMGFTGNRAKWPIGTEESKPFDTIAFVEGGPDILAAIEFCWRESRLDDVAVVGMLGSLAIAEDALPAFAGKRVRIFPHCDTAGDKAGKGWARQLMSVGAEVDGFSFAGLLMEDGRPVKDFNDLTSACPDSLDELELELMP